MGGSSSTPAAVGGGGGAANNNGGNDAPDPELATLRKLNFNWGLPPDAPPEDEKDADELVLQTWVSCRAKPSPAKSFRSDVEERDRRAALAWRKRSSFIELDCGEDSFFVSNTYKTVGVADGVGGWRDEGFDSSVFSNELMRLAKLFSETHRTVQDPEDVMQNAYNRLRFEEYVKAGASTACIASLRKIGGKNILDVANLGDSGMILMRETQVTHRVHEKTHGVNAPFQLSVLPPKYRNVAFHDRVSDCVREQFEVQEGDVLVMGTDGLFDNRFCSQIAADALLVGASPKSLFDQVPLVGGLLRYVMGGGTERTGNSDPYRVAQRICHQAHLQACSADADTPWARSMKHFGIENASGGKVDDVTVLLSRVVRRETAMNTVYF